MSPAERTMRDPASRSNVPLGNAPSRRHETTMGIEAKNHLPQQRVEERRCRAHPDSGLTQEQTEMLCHVLRDKRRALLEGHRQHLDTGRFSTERIAEAEEIAARDTLQSTLIDLAETERLVLLQVERALRKLEDGTYGVSEESGEPIGVDRLRAIPWATLSAADQEERERLARARRH
jgi:DnaK suppressor protein